MGANASAIAPPVVTCVASAGALVIHGLLSVAIIITLGQVIEWRRFGGGNQLLIEVEIPATMNRLNLLRSLELPIYALCGVTFIAWMFRAHKNLFTGRLDKNQFAARWTLLGFIVPVMNFIRPYEVMREIWAGSRFLAESRSTGTWRRVRPSVLMRWWWGSFISMCIVGGYGALAAAGVRSPEMGESSAWILLAIRLVSLTAVVLAVLVVVRITKLQVIARSRMKQPGDEDAA